MNEDTQYMVVRDFEAPKGGPWRYTVPETGFTVTGEYFKSLYANVRRHCEANNLPVPYQEDIEDGACRETNPGPSKCRKRPPKPVAGTLPHLSLAMAERFVLSVWGAIKDRKIVSKTEAERRFAVCMGCPLATDIGGCTGCYGILKTVEKLWAKNPLPDVGEKRFCGACGCATRLKPWLFNSTLDRAEKERPLYWEGCWRNQPDPPEVAQ